MDFWTTLSNIGIIMGIIGSIVSTIGYLYPSTPKTSIQKSLIRIVLPLALTFIIAGIIPYAISQPHNQQHTNISAPPSGTTTLSPTTETRTPNPSPTTEIQTPTMDTQNTTFSSNSGDPLYQANWSKGTDGWDLKDSGWSVLGNGSIVSNGTPNKASYLDPVPNEGAIFAPYQPHTANYAVEVQARITIDNSDDEDCSFCIIVRNDGSLPYYGYSGYAEGLDDSTDLSTTFDRTAWHTYRVEAKYNQITFFIDRQQISKEISNTYLKSGRIGIADKQGTQAEVRSFKVFAL